jgi:ABC-type transporter Mla MlaB component
VHDRAAEHAAGSAGPEDLDVRIEVSHGAARLRLAGPFTARTAGRVKGALELVSVAPTLVVIDMARVTQVDDAALDLLASARRTARREGWELALAGARGGGQAAQREAGRPSRTMVTNRTSKPARS